MQWLYWQQGAGVPQLSTTTNTSIYAWHFSSSPSLRHEAHWKLWEFRNAVSITADGGCVLSQARLSAGQVHITQNFMRGVPLWNLTGKRKGRFWLLQSRDSSYSMQTCTNNSSRKSTSCWTSVTLRKSYIQFPSTTHTCVQGPCLHKRWLTNDLDSQTITMMNLAFPPVKKKKKKSPQNSNTCFRTRLFFMTGEETWFTLSDIKHTCCGRQKNTSL